MVLLNISWKPVRWRSTLFSKATSVPGSRQTATLRSSTAEKPRVVVFQNCVDATKTPGLPCSDLSAWGLSDSGKQLIGHRTIPYVSWMRAAFAAVKVAVEAALGRCPKVGVFGTDYANARAGIACMVQSAAIRRCHPCR